MVDMIVGVDDITYFPANLDQITPFYCISWKHRAINHYDPFSRRHKTGGASSVHVKTIFCIDISGNLLLFFHFHYSFLTALPVVGWFPVGNRTIITRIILQSNHSLLQSRNDFPTERGKVIGGSGGDEISVFYNFLVQIEGAGIGYIVFDRRSTGGLFALQNSR